jgi:hypothetical protein
VPSFDRPLRCEPSAILRYLLYLMCAPLARKNVIYNVKNNFKLTRGQERAQLGHSEASSEFSDTLLAGCRAPQSLTLAQPSIFVGAAFFSMLCATVVQLASFLESSGLGSHSYKSTRNGGTISQSRCTNRGSTSRIHCGAVLYPWFGIEGSRHGTGPFLPPDASYAMTLDSGMPVACQ